VSARVGAGGIADAAFAAHHRLDVRRLGRRYVDALAPWRHDGRYVVPGEFVVVTAIRPTGD